MNSSRVATVIFRLVMNAMIRHRVWTVLLLFPLLAPISATAQIQGSWLAGDGDWHDAARWTPATVPDGAQYSAVVDSGAATGWTVTNATVIELGHLQIGSDDRVVHNGLNLTNSAFATAGVIDVAGTLQLYRPLFGGVLTLVTEGSFVGGGTVELGVQGNSSVADGLIDIGEQTLYNENTIRGNGRINMAADNGAGSPVGDFVNRAAGVVRADAGDYLQVSGGRVSNSGQFIANDGGTLDLTNNIITGAGSSAVERFAGGEVDATSVTFAGETLRSATSGTGAFELSACTLDGVQRRVQTDGPIVFSAGLNRLIGEVENKGELRIRTPGAAGQNTGLEIVDTAGVPTTLTGGGTLVSSPGFGNLVVSPGGTGDPIQTLRNVDNTISGGGLLFLNVDLQIETGGKLIANDPSEPITFWGESQIGQPVKIVNSGLLRASGGGQLKIQRPVITVGGATVEVAENSLLSLEGGAFVGGKLINNNPAYNSINNRGIEVIAACFLDGRPLGATPNPVELKGIAYAQGISLAGRIKAMDGTGSGTINNFGPVEIIGFAILDGIRFFLSNTDTTESRFNALEPTSDEVTLEGGAVMAGAGAIAVDMFVDNGSTLEAAFGTLELEAVNRYGTPKVIQNAGRIDAGEAGVLSINNTIINSPQEGAPALSSGAVVAYPGGLVRLTREIRGGFLSNQGTTGTKSGGASIEIDGGSLWDVTLNAFEPSALAGVFVANTSSTLRGTITNNTWLIVREGTGGGLSRLVMNGPVILAGSGRIQFEGTGSSIVAAGGNASLFQGAGHTLSGSVDIDVPFTNNGIVVVPEGQSASLSGAVSGTGNYQTTNGQITFIQPPMLSGPGGGLNASGTQGLISIPGAVTGAGGSIVALGGGNIVANGGGNIVANGGGNIVGSNAGAIVANGGGNIIAVGGGNIVANGGGNVVANGGGNVIANGGGNVVANGGGNIVANGGGNRGVSGGVQPGGKIIAEPGGIIAGSGTLETTGGVHVESTGVLRPGDTDSAPGLLSITGDLTLAPGSRLQVQLGGTTPGPEHDQVAVSGSATIGGALEASHLGAYAPANGATFDVLTANSISGSFASLALPAFPGRKTAAIQYLPQAVRLTVVQVSSFEQWKQSRFSLSEQNDPDISGPVADPDRDGTNNRLEYFFGTEPKVANSRASIISSIIPENGQRFFRLTFPRAQGMTDASFTIERSTNLADANSWQTAQHEIASTVAGDGVDMLTVKVLPAMGPQPEFFRVRVH